MSKQTKKVNKPKAKKAVKAKVASKAKAKAKAVSTKTPPRAKSATYKATATKELVIVTMKNHKDKKGGHPHVIVDNIDNKHVSVGLTTKSKKGKNATNYALEQSPLGDNKKSYMRRQAIVASCKEYEKSKQGKMTTKDFTVAKKYGDKAKQKYINKKSSEPPNTQ